MRAGMSCQLARAPLSAIRALQKATIGSPLVRQQPAVDNSRVPVHPLSHAVVVIDDALIAVLCAVLVAVVGPVFDDRELLPALVILRAILGKVKLDTVAVVVVERLRVSLSPARLGRA